MKLLFWVAYVLTVGEFLASPINTLMGSKMHLQRLKEARFPLSLAKVLAVVELFGVAGVIGGVWVPAARLVGGIVLAVCFLPIFIRAVNVERPLGDLLALAFFIGCALVTAFY